MASREDIERRLAAAEKAKHDLLTGKSARVLVDGNGERIEFTAINAARLDSYIEDLKRQLGLSAPLGPMVVFY